MSATLMPSPRQRFVDNVGLPLANGMVFTFAAGTSDKLAAFTDPDGLIPHENPIRLDIRGEATIYWLGNYKVDVRNALGIQLPGYPVDNFNAVDIAGLIAGGNAGFQALLASGDGAKNVSFRSADIGASVEKVSDVLERVRTVRRWGVKGDGTNEKVGIAKALTWANNNLPAKLIFPNGTYASDEWPNLARTGLTLEGESDRGVTLKCLSGVDGHTAFNFDAFTSGSASDPFIQRCNVRNIIFQGNAKTSRIVHVHGLARCSWDSVYAREAEPTAGIAFHFRGVQLSRFGSLMCSTDIDAMASIPYEGLRMEAGTRAGVNIGNSSNNTFINPYMEGLSIGARLASADQNTYIGGSFESSKVYDLITGGMSRYNSFIGMGFESPASTANIADGGISTKFLNCYANKKVLLQGRGAEISGGYYQRIEIQAGAVKNRVADITFGNWDDLFPTSRGYADSGTASEWKNLYDITAGAYIYPLASRTGITFAGPVFTWKNNTGQYVEVVLQTGIATQIRTLRGTDSWLCPIAIPGKLLLAPSDTIEVSSSGDVGMSYVPHNGFQG